MAKQTIDLKALLESKLGDVVPSEEDILSIDRVSKAIPENLMFNAETTEFKPVTKPVTTSGAKPLSVEEAKSFNTEMDRFIDECLVSGVDYGVIPNCKKPTLLKSGAEKIAIYLGLIFRTEVVSRTEDFAQGFFALTKSGELWSYHGMIPSFHAVFSWRQRDKSAKLIDYNDQDIRP